MASTGVTTNSANVTINAAGASTPTSTTSSASSTYDQAPGLLRISPQIFQFTASKISSGLVSKLKIKNLMQIHVGYKFKTNALMRYSVKPTLGVLAPGQSVEVFVRCESWINPQDRFLLQSVALDEHESRLLDASSWKDLDRRRIIETFIQCSSSSTLSMRDPQDDIGTLSSSSNTSSTTSSHATSNVTMTPSIQSEKARQQRAYLQRNGQTPIPTAAYVHAAGRKMSTGSTTSSTTSSPGSYPILNSSPKGGIPSSNSRNYNNSSEKMGLANSATVLISGSATYMTAKLSNAKQTIKTLTRFLAVRQYTKMQVFTVSVICLLLGLLLPLEKIVFFASGNSGSLFGSSGGSITTTTTITATSTSNDGADNAQFQNSLIGHRKAPIFTKSTAESLSSPSLFNDQPM